MYLIYKILKEIRYIMRSKSMKRLITLAILIVLLALFCSRVFAFELSTAGQTLEFSDFSTNGFNTATDIANYNILVLDLQNTANAWESRYWVWFLPAEQTNNLRFIYDPSSPRISLENFEFEETLTYYCAYYNKSGDRFVKKYGPSKKTASNANDIYFNGQTFDIIYSNLSVISSNIYAYCNFSLSLSTEEQTEAPVYIYTNWLDWSKASNYDIYMEMYPDTDEHLNVVLNTERSIEDTSKYRYYFPAEENGEYKFHFKYEEGNDWYITTKYITVSNIVTNTGGGATGETGERRRRNRRGRKWERL